MPVASSTVNLMSALEKLTPPQSPQAAAGRMGGSAGRKSGSAEPTMGDLFAVLTSMQESQGQVSRRLAALEAKEATSKDAAEKRETLAAAMAQLKPPSKTPKSKTPKPDRVLDLVRDSIAERQRAARVPQPTRPSAAPSRAPFVGGTPFPRRQPGMDSSDEEDEAETSGGRSWVPESAGYHPTFRARIRTNMYPTVGAWVRAMIWKNQRSGHEARRIATSVDCFEAEGIDDRFEGMRVLLTNLRALWMADSNPKAHCMLEATQYQDLSEPVPYDELRQALKDSERLAKVRDPAKKKNGGGGGNAGSGGGAGRGQ